MASLLNNRSNNLPLIISIAKLFTMERILLISLVTFLCLCCKDKSEKVPAAVKQVFAVVEIENRAVNGVYVFPATIKGVQQDEIRPKISGFIKEIFVDEGETVKKGQALFKIETNTQEMDAQAAKAEIDVAEANITAAEGAVAAAQVEVDKVLPLVEKKIVGQVQLETARANLLKAKGQLSQAIATREKAEANYYAILENIKFSNIESPLDGIIGRIKYSVGTLTGPNDPIPLTTVSDNSQVNAYFSLTEKEYIDFFQKFEGTDLEGKIERVPPIELELANGSIYEEKGKVQTTTGIIDPTTGTIQFRVLFPNEGRLLKSGNSGVIRVPRIYENAISIPNAATFEQQGMVYVYKVVADTARVQLVSILDKLERMAIVESGLRAGDQIVVSGLATLRNGTAIEPRIVSLDSIMNQTVVVP